MTNKNILLSVLALCLILPITALSATVSGTVVDKITGEPVDNIRVKFRRGTKKSGGGGMNIDWHYETVVRVGKDGAFSFDVPEPGVSQDKNDIFVLFTLSGVDDASRDYNTYRTENFLVDGDEFFTLPLTKITRGAMAIRVTDKEGKPLEAVIVGASLMVNAGETLAGVTDKDGRLLLENALSGNYRVTANGKGYAVVTVDGEVEEDETSEITIETEACDPPETGVVSGIIKDSSNNPIEDGVVSLKFGKKKKRTVLVGIADKDGKYRIENVPDDFTGEKGRLEAGADGYQDYETGWKVDEKDIEINCVLEPVGKNRQ